MQIFYQKPHMKASNKENLTPFLQKKRAFGDHLF